MRLSPRGAHGSFHGNTISDGSNRTAACVDAPVGSKLGSVLEMARERLSIQNTLSFYPWLVSLFLSRSFCRFLRTPLTSHLLTLCECILSCALSLSRTPLISPLPSFTPLVSLSLPVALQRKFNIGLFGVSKDSIRRSSEPYAKTNISCWGQEQQTSLHYPTALVFAQLDVCVSNLGIVSQY